VGDVLGYFNRDIFYPSLQVLSSYFVASWISHACRNFKPKTGPQRSDT